MNRMISAVSMVVLGLVTGAAFGQQGAIKPADAAMASIAAGNNQFALDLYAKLNANRDNLFFSPFSISTALAMTYAGADGQTASEMKQVLHFPFSDEQLHAAVGALLQSLTNDPAAKTEYQLNMANRLWGEERPYFKFRQDFLETDRTYYGAELEKVSFSKEPGPSATKINKWVSQQTAGKISQIVNASDFSPATLLVLTNAIYFKGQWTNGFKEADTSNEPFFLENGTQKDVPLMRQTEHFGYGEDDEVQLLEMNYRGDRLSMVVVLPREKNGLAKLEENLTSARLDAWLGAIRSRKVNLVFPRFRMETSYALSETLAAMGMPDAFSPERADFMKMIEYTVNPVPEEKIWIDKVLHKTYVDVNEKGTEAAAATAVIMNVTAVAYEEPPVVFRADHPFLFLIRDKQSGGILFLGRVMTP